MITLRKMKPQKATLSKLMPMVLAGALILCYSCSSEWLDIKADKQQAVPATLSDYQAMLDYVNSMVCNFPSLGEVASDYTITTEAFWNGSLSDVQRNAYTWSNDLPYVEVPDWNYNYSKILSVNVILDGIKRHGNKNSEALHIKGQALCLRSLYHYNLLQLYAKPYDVETAGTDAGIPLKLSSDITIPSHRATIRACYERIIADLEEAETYLPDLPLHVSRASKAGVQALLARIYLTMGNHDQALVCAERCLAIKNDLLDFNTLTPTANVIGLNQEIIFHGILQYYALIGANGFIDPGLIASYRDGDLRKVHYFQETPNGLHSFKGNYNTFVRDNYLFGGLAVDEIYLIRAECMARKGQHERALEVLNNLLESRWDKNVPFEPMTTADADHALETILLERKKELVWRGLRWSDLRRLNREERFRTTIHRSIGGQSFTLDPNSYRYTFPIPSDVIALTGMPQNEGWDNDR